MNWDRIEGNWKQVKGKFKENWGKLTDDDLDVIAGKRDQTLANIAHCGHIEVPPQNARRTATVGNCYNGSDMKWTLFIINCSESLQ